MDQIFNRLGNLIKSVFQDEDYVNEIKDKYSSYDDPDLKSAAEELDDFLNSDDEDINERKREKQYAKQRKSNNLPPEELRQDYANLKVPFGTHFEKVEKSYKKLIRKYHPDKYASSPGKLRSATEISAKINRSFQNIEKYIENKKSV